MSRFTKWLIGIAVIVVLGLIGGSQFITKVPNGHVGVVYSANGGVQSEALSPGWHGIWFFDKVVFRPTRLQTVEYTNIPVATKDGKNISIQNVSFNYQMDASMVVDAFKTLGSQSTDEIEQGYLRSRLLDATRKSISKYTVIDIYGEKSSEAARDTQTILTDNIAKLGFIVSDMMLGVPQPDAKTQEAIDARVTASQELERKTTELEIAKKEAERLFAEAKGVADAEIEEARGKSEANKLLEKSISKELIEYEIAKKWNGENSQYYSGNGSNGLNLHVTPKQ